SSEDVVDGDPADGRRGDSHNADCNGRSWVLGLGFGFCVFGLGSWVLGLRSNGLNLRHSDAWEGAMGGNGFRASEVRLEVLDEAFPFSKIERILEELNRQSVRVRKLPATMMVYYVIALGLFVSVGCREVLRRLLEASRWVWPDEVELSSETAITKARKRL